MSGLVLSVAPSERRLPPAINKTPQTIKDMYFIIKNHAEKSHRRCHTGLSTQAWQVLPSAKTGAGEISRRSGFELPRAFVASELSRSSRGA